MNHFVRIGALLLLAGLIGLCAYVSTYVSVDWLTEFLTEYQSEVAIGAGLGTVLIFVVVVALYEWYLGREGRLNQAAQAAVSTLRRKLHYDKLHPHARSAYAYLSDVPPDVKTRALKKLTLEDRGMLLGLGWLTDEVSDTYRAEALPGQQQDYEEV